jgi:hypothetical protein
MASGAASPVEAQGTLFVEGNRVGIGIETPTKVLHLFGASGDAGIIVQETNSTVAIRDGIQLFNNGRVQFRLTDTSANGGNPWAFGTREGAFQMNELNDGGELDFSISPAGDLTISCSLFANGGANSFPDYVFSPDYELMPLEELREFVDREGHLPNIESAEQVRTKGVVNMTELQMKLLEKVEELTLYVLELKDEADQLRAENVALRQSIGAAVPAAETLLERE